MKESHFLRCDFSAKELDEFAKDLARKTAELSQAEEDKKIEEALEQALEQAVEVVNSGALDTPDMTIRAKTSGWKRKE